MLALKGFHVAEGAGGCYEYSYQSDGCCSALFLEETQEPCYCKYWQEIEVTGPQKQKEHQNECKETAVDDGGFFPQLYNHIYKEYAAAYSKGLGEYPVVVEGVGGENGIEQGYPETDAFRCDETADGAVEYADGKEIDNMLYENGYPVTCGYAEEFLEDSDDDGIYGGAKQVDIATGEDFPCIHVGEGVDLIHVFCPRTDEEQYGLENSEAVDYQ